MMLVLVLVLVLSLLLTGLEARAELAGAASTSTHSTTPAASSDLITTRSFIRDPSGQLSLAQVQALSFTPYRGPLVLGNSAAITWLKLTLAPATGDDWWLLIQPALLQDVQVFEPARGGGWRVHRLGNQFAHAEREVKSLTFTVPVWVDAQAQRTLYLRVKTPSAAMHVRVVPEADVRELDGRLHGLVGVYAGIGLTMLMLSAAGWVVTRQRLWLCSALVDLATLALTALQLGFVAKYLLPGAEGLLHHAVVIANCAHLAVVSLFFWQLYRQFLAPRWVTVPYLAAVCVFPLLMLLQGVGKPASALALNNLMILGLSLWGFVAVWFVRPSDRLTCILLRVMAIALALYMLYWVSPLVLQWHPPTTLSLYPTLPSNLFTMVMTVLLLARDTQLRTRAARQLQEDKRVSERKRSANPIFPANREPANLVSIATTVETVWI